MNWKRIPKEESVQPVKGVYSDWKPELAVEGFKQCVYCTISEASFGGIRNFHVEHYKPKGDTRFAALENTYSNLFYACAICNTFKSDDWPADPDDNCSIDCFPDPGLRNYGDLFTVDKSTGLISGKNVTGKYILNKLYLNRPQLIINRRESIAIQEHDRIAEQVNEQKDQLFILAKDQPKALEKLKELDLAIRKLDSILRLQSATSPYNDNQVKREKRK